MRKLESFVEATHLLRVLRYFVGLSALLVALWFGLPWLFSALRDLQQEVAVSLAVGVLTVAGFLWRRRSELKENRRAHIRDQKMPVYEAFLRFWLDTMYRGVREGRSLSQGEIHEYMVDSVPGFVFWASPGVLRRWNQLRQEMASAETPGLRSLLGLEDLMFTMRADLEQDNSNLERGDLLALWVNDINEVLRA